MTIPVSPSRSRFEAVWLAEAVRLCEEERGAPLAGFGESLPMVAESRTDQDWLLRRAAVVGSMNGLREALQQWQRHARVVLLLLGVLAMVSGFSAALGFFPAQERAVNVLWTLLGLIALPALALLLWLVVWLTGGRIPGGVFGRLWLWLVDHWRRSVFRVANASANPSASPSANPSASPSANASANAPAVHVTQALSSLMNRSGLGRWWLSTITHSLWSLALASTLTGMLVALSLRSYAFVLETTILSPELFASVVQGLGAVPALLGFAIPDAAMISAALTGDVQAQSEAMRRAWASWLCGGVLVYALLPRVLLWAVALLRMRVLRGQLQLDPCLPGYSALLQRSAPSPGPGIVDVAPPEAVSPRVAPIHHVHGRASALLAMELGPDVLWPPRHLVPGRQIELVGEVVETREQRRSVLAHLASAPPARLLLACDARLSPDRGTQHWIIELSQRTGELRIWLLGLDTAGERLRIWQDSLGQIGLADNRIVTTETAALNWLNHHE